MDAKIMINVVNGRMQQHVKMIANTQTTAEYAASAPLTTIMENQKKKKSCQK